MAGFIAIRSFLASAKAQMAQERKSARFCHPTRKSGRGPGRCAQADNGGVRPRTEFRAHLAFAPVRLAAGTLAVPLTHPFDLKTAQTAIE
jgi:hypothetical protein